MGMVQSMAVETFGVVDVEEPKYEVVLKRDGGPVHYEIRRYGKRCINIPLLFLQVGSSLKWFPQVCHRDRDG